ncbi:small molecule metabolism [Agrobacterium tumefaciens LBA4213 (Ach5)]|nr:small molecule metabolism [Agrobacterium tumefaciens LBA4213 (Ach5)]
MWSFLSGLAFILFDFHSHSGLRSQGLKPFGTPSTRFCRSIFPFLFIIFFLALRQFPITFMPPFKISGQAPGHFHETETIGPHGHFRVRNLPWHNDVGHAEH